MDGGAEENVEASWSSPEGRGFQHYLITRSEPNGFEDPYAYFRHGEGVVPVFCSDGAARRYLGSLAPEDEWHVREFSPGELVSLLFALHERVAWVLPDPCPHPRPVVRRPRTVGPAPLDVTSS